MAQSKLILCGTVAVALAAIALWNVGIMNRAKPRDRWRYEMTVEVQTPDGVHSGSAVREVDFRPRGDIGIAAGRDNWSVRGEAVVVDLPNGRTLYALMRAWRTDVDYGARISDRVLGEKGHIRGYPGPVELYPTAPRTTGLEQTNPVPMLVTFADPHRSITVQPVDPHDLAASFGDGYALKRITIEVVDDPVTTGIEQRLPWVARQNSLDPSPWGVTANPTTAQLLTASDFLRGQ